MLFLDNFLIFSIKHMLWALIRSYLSRTSNDYHNICFYGELEKIISELSSNILPGYIAQSVVRFIAYPGVASSNPSLAT